MKITGTDECELCLNTGWYGDNGAGILGNNEIVECDCGHKDMCQIGVHPYRIISGIPWCDKCDLEADLSICKMIHPVMNAPACLEVIRGDNYE